MVIVDVGASDDSALLGFGSEEAGFDVPFFAEPRRSVVRAGVGAACAIVKRVPVGV
jgi:hypothetical protein